MYDAVLFDMDGVVVDTQHSVQDFWQRLARSEGYSLSAGDLDQHVYGHRADHTLRRLFPQITPDRYGQVYALLRQDQQSLAYTAIPGVLRLLRQLTQAGVRLALVTGAQDWKVAEVLGQLDLTDAFDVQVSAEDVTAGKPDPAGYLQAAQRLGIDIASCLVFEDAISGVTSAVTAGADCVAIAPPQGADRVLAAGALTALGDFEDISFDAGDHVLRVAGTPATAEVTTPATVTTEFLFSAARDASQPDGRGDSAMAALFAAPADRWDAAATALSGQDEVIYRSHLVGSDPALTKEGGGNFSAKGAMPDHRGRTTRVLWMSAWGCDGASTTAADFPVLRLDDLLELRDSGPLSETGMIDYLADCGLRGDQRRPGIETLTHAFIPAPHVDHCHPDAVIALTSFPAGRAAARAEFGDEAIWFDYRQFDVEVARELADQIAAQPRARFVLLANHGLFTWAQTSEQCYRNSLEAVARSVRVLEQARLRPPDLGGPVVPVVPPDTAPDLLAEILPAIRGALSADGRGVVLHLNRSDDAALFASSARGPRSSLAGPGCPDHVVTVGYRPLALDRTPAGPGPVLDAIGRYRDWYDSYFEQHVPAPSRGPGKRADVPRAIVLPGIGVVTSGPDAAKARLCADHFIQTMTVIRAADAAGGYQSLTPAQAAADEYWPLMRLKPQLAAPDGHLSGQVFLVAGVDGARIGPIADRLAAAGAHVALAGSQSAQLAAVAGPIAARHGERRAVPVPFAIGRPRDAVRGAVLAYGGFDALIDLTGSADLVHAARTVFARQGGRGSVLLAPEKWSAERLGRQVAGLADGPAGVAVNGIVGGSPAAVAEAAAFFAGTAWTGTVLQPAADLIDDPTPTRQTTTKASVA
jgi:HAD superfamily hydrolase (TIGR01509 family)